APCPFYFAELRGSGVPICSISLFYRLIALCFSTVSRRCDRQCTRARMAESESIDPEPEDFAAAEATVGPLCEEIGSPAAARIRYEAAQAHKLVRLIRDMAQRIPEPGAPVWRPSKRNV